MQKISLFMLFCVSTVSSYGQLFVQNGAIINTTGNAIITLQDMDLQNNGTIQQPVGSGGKFLFNGNNQSIIIGTGTALFDIVEVAKQNNISLQLQSNIQVQSGINFTSGLIDMNGYDIELIYPTTTLNGENESSRVTGLNGGFILSSATMNNPSQLNLSDMGAVITSSQNLGNVQIQRSHKPAVNPNNASYTGIQRTYFINPATNTNLNATLRFYYFNAELNGKNQSSLTLWKSMDGISWVNIGIDTRDVVNKYVEKTGIADFSYWTLSDAANLLPITLISFKAVCEDNYTLIQWQTATEVNAASFIVQRCTDDSIWTDIQTFVANNNINGSSYTYKDLNPQPTALYRLKMTDIDGNAQYSAIFNGGCSEAAMPFVVYPNPVNDNTTARLSVRHAAKASLCIYSISGQLVKQYVWNLVPGINTFNITDISSLVAGVYIIKAIFNGSYVQKKVIKK